MSYTDSELDRMADEAVGWVSKRYQPHYWFRRVLLDGKTKITAVEHNGEGQIVAGFVRSSCGERFPVFDPAVLFACRCALGKWVKLDLKMSARGTRYVVGLKEPKEQP